MNVFGDPTHKSNGRRNYVDPEVSFSVLFVTATLADGVFAGASVDPALVQLPARHAIGAPAYSAFSVKREMQLRGRAGAGTLT
jgi:hypothetical protein